MLEIVEVEVEHADGLAATAALGQQPVELLVEVVAVGQAGQPVVARYPAGKLLAVPDAGQFGAGLGALVAQGRVQLLQCGCAFQHDRLL